MLLVKMNKIDLEKNRIDLQILNIILISGIGTFFAYLGALILNPEKALTYTAVIILIASFTYVFYRRVDNNLKELSEQIKSLI